MPADIKTPRKIFLMGYEKLNEVQRSKVAELLMRYPSLKAFYRDKAKIRKLY
ncbi:MAG: hypothetical protein R6U93_04705 [Dehalococcoidia bacterium]